MNEVMKDIINENNYNLMSKLIMNNIPFAFVLAYHGNWNEQFPDRLKDQKHIIISIKDQALEDSFVENGKIKIVIDIDGVTYMKFLEYADILAIQENEKSQMPFASRPFLMTPTPEKVVSKKFAIPSDSDLTHSINIFKKYNPEMFEEIKWVDTQLKTIDGTS